MSEFDISYNNLTSADFSRSKSQLDEFILINMEFNSSTELKIEMKKELKID